MFSELVASPARPSSKRKCWALVISATLETVCLLILILVPLIYTQALPNAIFRTDWVAPPEPVAQAAAQAPPPGAAMRSSRLLNHRILVEPPRIPKHVNIFEEPPLPPEAPLAEGLMSPVSGVDLLGVGPGPADRLIRPAPPSAPERVRLTSTIEAAKLVSQIQPVYPPIAIQARVQGHVVLHAIIGKEGAVSELEVLSGHPLLVSAVLKAVRQWRYSPTLLNGQPVEVETTITVTFLLGQ
jgi:protein TonB